MSLPAPRFTSTHAALSRDWAWGKPCRWRAQLALRLTLRGLALSAADLGEGGLLETAGP